MEVEHPADEQSSVSLNRLTILADVGSLVFSCFSIFALFFIGNWFLGLLIRAEIFILIGLVSSTVFAAVATVLLVRFSRIDPGAFRFVASRLGARAGLVVGIFGGGILVFTTGLISKGILASDVAIQPLPAFAVVALSLVFLVSLGSIVAVALIKVVTPKERSPLELVDEIQQNSESNSTRTFFPWVIFVALLLMFGHHYLPNKNRLSASDVESSGESLPVALDDNGDVEVNTEISFEYKQPFGFHTAPPSHWKLQYRKTIEDIDCTKPITLSPDGVYLAYFLASEASTLVIFDLDRFEIHKSFPGYGEVAGLAWSPKLNRLLFYSKSQPPRVEVWKEERQKMFRLPMERNDSLPVATPYWWNQFELAFFPEQGQPTWLDLDELEIRPIVESVEFQQRSRNKSNVRAPLPPRIELPESDRCRFIVAPAISSYSPPDFQQSSWVIDWKPVLAISDKSHPHVSAFPELEMTKEIAVATTSEATKIVRVGSSDAEVAYFSLVESPEPFFRVEAPSKSSMKSESLEDYRNSQVLCAFVCAPRVNPLTNKVIGPDRGRVKAIARLVERENDELLFWVAERYRTLKNGDVLADFHVWVDGNPRLVESPFGKGWFGAVEGLEKALPISLLPTSLKPLDRNSEYEFKEINGQLKIQGFRFPVATKKVATIQDFEIPAIEPLLNGQIDLPMIGQDNDVIQRSRNLESLVTKGSELITFVRNHYRKLSERDVEGFLGDYTSNIVYFGHAGPLDEVISADVASILRFKKVTMNVAGPVDVTPDPNDPNRSIAIFDLEIVCETNRPSKFTDLVKIELGVFSVAGKFQIVSEATASSKGKSTGQMASRNRCSPDELRAFLTGHFEKFNAQDDDGWLEGYHSMIKGDIDRSSVATRGMLKDLMARNGRPSAAFELIIRGPVLIEPWKELPGRYTATFDLERKPRSHSSGRRSETVRKVYYLIETQEGPKIYGANTIAKN